MNCTFSNSTRSIQVPASRLNSSTIICTAPSWRSDLGNPEFLSVGLAGNELISLLVSSGNCATRLPFQLYSEPKVLGVSPLQGPRYGSFDLRVNLAYSLSSFPQDGMVRFFSLFFPILIHFIHIREDLCFDFQAIILHIVAKRCLIIQAGSIFDMP